MSCDPNFNDVVLLLPFDGTNGQTTTTDLSSLANVMTFAGDATLTTTSPAFGTASLNLPDTSTAGAQNVYTSVVAGGPLDILSGSADFTIEGLFWINSGHTGTPLCVFDYGNDHSGGGFNLNAAGLVLLIDDAHVNITTGVNPGSPWGGINDAIAVPTDQWVAFALVRSGGVGTLYISGNAVAGNPTWAGFTLSGSYHGFVNIGGSQTFNGGTCPGKVDEFRVTAGVARYTTNYTPDVVAFPTFACTQTVPDVIGLDDTAAQAAILAANLTVGSITTGINPAPPGTVFSQSPVGGTIATAGDPVDIVESEGVLVPDVTNTSATVIAPGILAAAGFVIGVTTYAASGVIIAGNVISQNPTAGSFAAAGSGINLVVSTGLPPLTVPDIFGLSQADAELALTSVGLVVGAISSAPSKFVPPNLVQAQNPSAGTAVAVGTIVSFVLSLGNPAVATAFDFEATVISQYANSPTILQLATNLNSYIDQSTNFANFYNFVWNVDTAVGFGLDIWGKIVGVSRLLHIPTTVDYVGFDNSATPPPDWQTMGSDQDNPPVGGAMYTGYNATQTYLLPDDAYRQLVLAKAFANICTTTAPAINQILQNLYGPGTAWVLNTGTMAISYNLSFHPSAIQLAILEQSGVIPTPPGVSVTVIAP